jgi:ribosomal 50S subunit-recycling heat shock protein
VIYLRLDKYLKNSRLIKRRTVAKDACEGEKVYLNGKQAKPSAEVKVGDIVEIVFGEKRIKAEITDISDNASKASAKEMYKLI